MTDIQFAMLFASLAVVFNKEPNPKQTDIYFSVLKDLPDDRLEIAFKRALTDCKFFPSIAELIELAGCREEKELEAERWWPRILEAMQKHGAYKSISFSHPVNPVIEAMGGWVSLCHQDKEWLNVWGRKQFLELYRAYAPMPAKPAHYLMGIHEQTNRFNGLAGKIDPPVLIEAEAVKPALKLLKGEINPDVKV